MAITPGENEIARKNRATYQSYVGNPTPSFMDSVYSRARDTGWTNPNRWLVMIIPNENVRSGIGMNFVEDVARLATTCKSVNPQEQTWYSSEQNYIHAGPTRVFPYKKNTNNSSGIRLQFNCGTDMFEKEFFEYWLRYIQFQDTRQFRFYDEYAKGSEMYVLLLPNHVKNFASAIEAMYQNKIVGFKLTEIYPFSMNINGGSLNYQTGTEPMFVDISFMYHDIVPLNNVQFDRDKQKRFNNVLPQVTETGYPYIEENRYADILKESQKGLNRAVNGFAVGSIAERAAFNNIRQQQQAVLYTYMQELEKYKANDIPTAVDGRLVYQTPKQGGLDLGLTLLSQTQGFFGAGFFGNGWYP